MTENELLQCLAETPERVGFDDVLAVIDAGYHFTAQAFRHGAVVNAAGSNAGSCRVLAFARLHGLSDAQTLACFGRFYRDVLATPDGDDHANIRQLIKTGLAAVQFDGSVLEPKA